MVSEPTFYYEQISYMKLIGMNLLSFGPYIVSFGISTETTLNDTF